jgi:hypothetical protein
MSNIGTNALYKSYNRDKDKQPKIGNDRKFVLFLQAILTVLWKREFINISTT